MKLPAQVLPAQQIANLLAKNPYSEGFTVENMSKQSNEGVTPFSLAEDYESLRQLPAFGDNFILLSEETKAAWQTFA